MSVRTFVIPKMKTLMVEILLGVRFYDPSNILQWTYLKYKVQLRDKHNEYWPRDLSRITPSYVQLAKLPVACTVFERRQAKIFRKQRGRLLNFGNNLVGYWISESPPLALAHLLSGSSSRQRCDSRISNAHSDTRSRVGTGDGWTPTSSIRLSTIEKECESFVESTTTRWWWSYRDKEVLGGLWSGTAARYATTMLSLTVLVMI